MDIGSFNTHKNFWSYNVSEIFIYKSEKSKLTLVTITIAVDFLPHKRKLTTEFTWSWQLITSGNSPFIDKAAFKRQGQLSHSERKESVDKFPSRLSLSRIVLSCVLRITEVVSGRTECQDSTVVTAHSDTIPCFVFLLLAHFPHPLSVIWESNSKKTHCSRFLLEDLFQELIRRHWVIWSRLSMQLRQTRIHPFFFFPYCKERAWSWCEFST